MHSACVLQTVVALASVAADPGSRLLLVRHGETNFNSDGRLQGRLESELTAKGHEQASALGQWLTSAEAASVDRVFVSPKKRTRQTLAGIESHATSLPAAEVRPGAREIELTIWEGQYKMNLKDADGNDDSARWAQWNAHPASFVFDEDGHAPLVDLKSRAKAEWLHYVAATPAESTSLVVAHGAFNRVFLMTALGLPVDDFGFNDKHFEFENCALIELSWTAGATHASAWRKRYPSASEWRTRDEEVQRRMREEHASLTKGEL